MTTKKLYRSNKNSIIMGVCGGIGEYFDIDPTIVRLVLVFFALITVILPFIIAYSTANIIILPLIFIFITIIIPLILIIVITVYILAGIMIPKQL